MKPISFLTDYGLADEFVGVCKGVLHQLAPGAPIVDITHLIAPHDVRAGSLALVRSVQYLPDGIVLAIVDPGVGTARKAIAVEAGAMIFVGPDNGLLAPAVAMLGGARSAVALTNDEFHLAAPGATFAGRDIFAPVAARLSSGTPLVEFGDAIDPVTLTPGIVPLSRIEDDYSAIHGEALWVDHFGNVQLNIGPEEVSGFGEILSLTWGGKTRTVRVLTAYGEIKGGEVGLVIDSYGLLSVCVDRSSASRELGLGAGSAVTIAPAL
jgi:S-adenosyl-L-methionine hydrolase (adenosine-forming)